MPPTLAVCDVTWSGQGIGRVLTYRPLDGSAPIRFAVWSRADLRREQAIVDEALRRQRMNATASITEPQTAYVRALQRKLRLPNRMLDDHCVTQFGVSFAELDKRQASALLEEMIAWEALPAEMQKSMGQQTLAGF